MSENDPGTKPIGGAEAAAALLEQSKRLIEEASADEAQLELLSPISAEEMEIAQAEMGLGAGHLAVLHQARENRKGRKPGSTNRRTDDFRRYLLSFGQDPAITLMQIQNTQPETLMARSKGLDFDKRRLSYGDAQSLRVRCAEALMPYIHSKQPIAVDATIRGVVVQETIGRIDEADGAGGIIDGEIVGVIVDGEVRSI